MFQPILDQNTNVDRIEKERLDLYMKDMVPHYLGAIFTSAPFMYFIFYESLVTDIFPVWLSIAISLGIVVALVYYFFYKHYDRLSLSSWKLVSYFPLIGYSLYMASASWLLLQTNTNIYVYTMIVVLISLTGTTAYAISYYLTKYFIFLTLPLLSLAIKISVMGIENTGLIYGVLLFLWVSSFSFGHHIHKSLMMSIKLKFENIQARLNAERANIEKSQFIAAASHDIRQPLQAVSLFTSTLKSRNKNTKNDILFERLENSVDSMSELLNDLLDVSKLDAQVITPQPQHLELDVMFKRLQSEFEFSAKERSIELAVNSNGCIAFSDTILLERILNNLLSNAIRYTASGKVDLIAFIDAEKMTISITDTGMGIPLEEQTAIFMEFYQLNNPERNRSKGLGLGLPIVKRLCELQNWPLELTSEVEKGTCFSFSLPIGKRELIQKTEENNTVLSLQGLNILVIEDDEDVRFSLLHLLEGWGCNVHAFESSEEACETLNASPLWRPNCLISDYRLANNKTGLEAVRDVRLLLNESVFSLIITGDTAPDKIQEIEASGLIVFHKPIKPARLRSVIHHKMKHVINKSIS
ncbi:MAG: signal transduction histidine kinase/CheY-like chemotaxis protein [Glaciecola sp.]